MKPRTSVAFLRMSTPVVKRKVSWNPERCLWVLLREPRNVHFETDGTCIEELGLDRCGQHADWRRHSRQEAAASSFRQPSKSWIVLLPSEACGWNVAAKGFLCEIVCDEAHEV